MVVGIDKLTIMVKPPGSQWVELGTDVGGYDVRPQGLTFQKNLIGGLCTTGGFAIPRKQLPWNDLGKYTPIWIGAGPMDAWSGRITQAARDESGMLQVQMQGWWPGHLTDDILDRAYIVNDLTRFADCRSLATVNLANFAQNAQVSTDSHAISIGAGVGGGSWGNQNGAGVTIDLGPNDTCASVGLDWASNSSTGAGFALYVRTHSNPDPANPGTFSDWGAVPNVSTPLTNTFFAGGTSFSSCSSPQRYLSIFVWNQTGGAATFGTDFWFKVTGIRIATKTAYLSSGASVLTATTAIQDVLAAICPKVSNDYSLMQATSFHIDQFETGGYQSADTTVTKANSYHGWQAYLTPERLPRFAHRPQPTRAVWVVTKRDGEFVEGAADDSTQVWNKIVTQFTDPTGIEGFQQAAQTGTILDRTSTTRAKLLQAGSVMTSVSALQLAAAELAMGLRPPMRGSIPIEKTIGQYPGNARFPVSCLNPGDGIFFVDEIDPSTGGRGRLGILAGTDYSHDTKTIQLTMDSTNDYVSEIDARIGA